MQEAFDEAVNEVESGGAAAIVTKKPCVLIKGLKLEKALCEVDTEKCRVCKMCTKVGCPAIAMQDKNAWIDGTLCTGCGVCRQVCPFGVISAVEVAK